MIYEMLTGTNATQVPAILVRLTQRVALAHCRPDLSRQLHPRRKVNVVLDPLPPRAQHHPDLSDRQRVNRLHGSGGRRGDRDAMRRLVPGGVGVGIHLERSAVGVKTQPSENG